MVENPPSTSGEVSSIPGGRTKIPHAAGQLRPRATTTEPVLLNERAYMLQTTEPQLEREKSARHNWRKACTLQLERSPHAQ